MPTNKVVLRSTDEFMSGYVPVYQPMYPLFLGKSKAYSEEVGKISFKRMETVGDIRNRHITPKDTEIKQIAAIEKSKTFKKYFLASQYTQSALQDQKGNEDVIAQVLDEHQKHMDDLFLLGEGTSNSTMINNGLFHSNDPNYRLESTLEVDTDADPCIDLHTKSMALASMADANSGRKVMIFYGSALLPIFNSVYAAQPVPFKSVLGQILGPKGYSFAEMPAAVTPAGENGIIVANYDQVMLHYTTLPKLAAQGVNEEKMYTWHNFLMGSCMLEVLADDAVIRQVLTVET